MRINQFHFRALAVILASTAVACQSLKAGVAGPITLFIDDSDPNGVENITATPLSQLLLDAGGTLQITQEGTGILGLVDYSFEFVSIDPNHPVPGITLVNNYNIFDGTGVLSDTLNIVVTGHTPAFTGDANVSVDVHFRSDSLDGISPTFLANGTPVVETGGFQLFGTGLTDFKIYAASEVPESSQTLSGIAGLAVISGGLAYFRRRNARVNHPISTTPEKP
ncbi:MAG TPA: hypothetical protein VMF06_07185 [Candidatus Limnocylindria bacterium]|jgi:hypothetical protein|nr:hypothetical protein [Candidatus Limnocylindria bacterium]